MYNNNTLFTAGQFAKLMGINKRTLHFYDEIGLFSPAHKGENGYRYYTYHQSAILEMLLAWRELGMSIEEISEYIKDRSAQSFQKILEEKTLEIDEKIKNLKEIRRLLKEKEEMILLCNEETLTKIELINYPEEYLLLSRSISGTYDDDDYAVLIEHINNFSSHRLYNKKYGSMINSNKILCGDFENYDCFFTKLPKKIKHTDLFVKPKGTYIRAFCKGEWSNIPQTYKKIIDFSKNNNLLLTGYSFEEGINEMSIKTMEEYVTQITILCEKSH